MIIKPSPTELLQAVAEPTRLRILNCLAAAPLFVADLQEVLALPQPTVSRHLQILRKADLVRDTPIAPFVLYRLKRSVGGPLGRMLDRSCRRWRNWSRRARSGPGHGSAAGPSIRHA
jgi:DNA-binding transcriptional ArsR family regulator